MNIEYTLPSRGRYIFRFLTLTYCHITRDVLYDMSSVGVIAHWISVRPDVNACVGSMRVSTNSLNVELRTHDLMS